MITPRPPAAFRSRFSAAGALFAFTLGVLFIAGCNHSRVVLEPLPAPPGAALRGDDALTLAAGTAWIFDASPEGGGDDVVHAHATGSLVVRRAAERNLFVVVGERPGRGTLTFDVGGHDVKTLTATVTAQHEEIGPSARNL